MHHFVFFVSIHVRHAEDSAEQRRSFLDSAVQSQLPVIGFFLSHEILLHLLFLGISPSSSVCSLTTAELLSLGRSPSRPEQDTSPRLLLRGVLEEWSTETVRAEGSQELMVCEHEGTTDLPDPVAADSDIQLRNKRILDGEEIRPIRLQETLASLRVDPGEMWNGQNEKTSYTHTHTHKRQERQRLEARISAVPSPLCLGSDLVEQRATLPDADPNARVIEFDPVAPEEAQEQTSEIHSFVHFLPEFTFPGTEQLQMGDDHELQHEAPNTTLERLVEISACQEALQNQGQRTKRRHPSLEIGEDERKSSTTSVVVVVVG